MPSILLISLSQWDGKLQYPIQVPSKTLAMEALASTWPLSIIEFVIRYSKTLVLPKANVDPR